MLNRMVDYGTVMFEGKEYELQEQAKPTSRLLPDHMAGCFEMTALAIGEDNRAYEVSWAFKDDERDLDQYDYSEVYAVRAIDVPVFLVQMVRGTVNSFDETSVPKTIFRTTDIKKAKEVFSNTEPIDTDELDYEGCSYYYAPVIVRVWGEASLMMD